MFVATSSINQMEAQLMQISKLIDMLPKGYLVIKNEKKNFYFHLHRWIKHHPPQCSGYSGLFGFISKSGGEAFNQKFDVSHKYRNRVRSKHLKAPRRRRRNHNRG